MLSTKPPKPPRCRHCRERTDGGQIHPDCAPAWWEAEKARKAAIKARVERECDKVRREKLKTPGQKTTELEAKCRKIVQHLARIRDRNDGCISCHVGPDYGGQWHGSHFRPAGNNAAVQLHLWNIHKACAQCNKFKGGNLSEYRPRLVEKIGADRVAWLDSQTQPVKQTPDYIEYLRRFQTVMGKRLYRAKRRVLEVTA